MLQQQAANVQQGHLMGSAHTYVLPGEGKRCACYSIFQSSSSL